MASSSMKNSWIEEEDDLEEEFEYFDDFTLASSWERFISEIEAVCRQWLADGPKNLLEKGAVRLEFSKNLHMVKSDLKYALKSYCIEYYFTSSNDVTVTDWNSDPHDLQLSFGVKDFLVIAPQSASGVILDAPEASKLLSAIAISLSNCSSLWPAFVPVHDPSRKAYIGIQNMGTVFTRRFEADQIGSQVPLKLMHLEGLYELFVSKFAFSTLDISMHLFKVNFTMKLTYKTLPYEDDEQITETTESGGEGRKKTQWDDDCPWSEWYSAEDPVKGFEFVAVWSEKTIESSMEMAELENASIHEAEKWFIYPTLSPNLNDVSVGNRVGFASQLHFLVDALDLSLDAQFLEDFVSVESSASNSSKSSAFIPPPTVLDRVLKDLFHEGGQFSFSEGEHKSSRMLKGAPLESLFAQFCLHALWFGDCNIRAVAVLWIEFVREVRWCWEESEPVPRMPSNAVIDLSTCLINQKLHMLAICIAKKRQQTKTFQGSVENQDEYFSSAEEDNSIEMDSSPRKSSDGFGEERDSSSKSSNLSSIRKGSAGIVGSVMLLNSREYMHAPFTQDAPVMTEDMHEERLQAVEALGDSFNFSAQLEKDILLSDMSAFKAANPLAVFEDFIRWHSPKDWENDENADSARGGSRTKNWPPKGRLSDRMSEKGNSWRKIWKEAPALPVSHQKPLLDFNQEGEKVLHYLETLRPHQLLEQMVCTAFRAAADTLHQTTFGDLKLMTTKITQLYLTIASTLRPLHANNLSNDSDVTDELRKLCGVFEHVEKLLAVASSLHRKFSQSPRLSQAIFTDFFNFYLPKMGTPSVKHDNNKEFESKQEVNIYEKEVIANMFTAPTANQSWRKVLSMGNLLNGHEPSTREIIFSVRDKMNDSGSYYSPRSSSGNSQQEQIETYRMYISGSSNDIRVALSVTSCD